MEISKEEFENIEDYINNLLCIANNCDPAYYLEPEYIEAMEEQYVEYCKLLERLENDTEKGNGNDEKKNR